MSSSSISSRLLQELADGLGAVGLGELGGVADQGVHRGAYGVDDHGREQGAGLGEPGRQLAAGRGGGLAGKDQVAKRAKSEDVEQRR